MAKFIIDVWMDGYESEEEMIKACPDFIYEALDSAGTSVSIIPLNEQDIDGTGV